MQSPTSADAKGLSLRSLNKSFGAVHVVKDLSIEIQPGEFLVLLGPSGCGKTTALRMIAGLESADSGTIELGGENITNVLPKYRDIAMVFQSYALYPHKTVAENIGFPLKVAGLKPEAINAAIAETAAQVHMSDYLERYPRELSGGQRQRVALGRAMIRRPEAFLMDEPLSNLDAKLRGHMRAELKHMQHDLGTTTVYVTHDQIEAMTLAHRVAIMNEGVLQQLGTPREVYDEPATLFVAGFMGSPPMNFVHGTIDNRRFMAAGIDLPVDGNASSSKTVLGFRPEDSTVGNAGEGLFDTRVFTSEQTGEYTLVTVVLGEDTMTVKMPRDFDAPIHSTVCVNFPLEKGFFFDRESGRRESIRLSS
ncbi:ABC transporter ATP-binding protein [Chromatiales bacterium (ex Bugula neritina AB1)]|nr:ABC transporter ATP-binding protein [Chromatiales bacterium (ex Bugula neritina AB1)]